MTTTNTSRTLRMLQPSWLRLTPRAECVAGARYKRLIRRAAITPSDKLHVHRGGFGISQALAAGQELFERVREQLIRGHVLSAPEQFAGRNLVENRGHLVIPGQTVDDVALERSNGVL